MDEPFDWPKNRRDHFSLGPEKGVYALFLRRGAELPLVAPRREGLIYVGKASGHGGLARRCHFQGDTRVHSPRKSLAVLLRNILGLRPVLAKGKRPTWALDAPSEVTLSDWMHVHLEVAFRRCPDPVPLEASLIRTLEPPLNLTLCHQSDTHRRISALRRRTLAEVRGTAVA